MKIKLLIIFLFTVSCLFGEENSPSSSSHPDDQTVFRHGVASGDPLQDRVILWTRVSSKDSEPVDVRWEVAKDRSFSQIALSGSCTTHADRDYTVKVEAYPLEPGEQYYYRFYASDESSDIGRTRTLPSGDAEHVNLAVVSCSHYEYGYFNAYAAIAEDRLLDAVLHLGDYFYEYRARANRFGKDWDRKHEPDHELVSLDDYRTRYAQYRTDPDLQAAHRNHPFITVWDDHESANNSSMTGAENHDPGQGKWEARKQASKQAYLEWMPVREQDSGEIYRDFVFGDLAHLVMLDTRLAGRDEQIYDLSDERVYEPDRSLLGKDQLQWLDDRLGKTNTKWTVFGNQVIFSPRIYGMDPVRGRNGDSWDGYPEERLRVWKLIERHGIHNWIIATGDTHQTFVFDLVSPMETRACPSREFPGSRGMEFGVPSISAANPGDRLEAGEVTLRELRLIRSGMNPHLKWVDMRNHGYLRVELSHDKAEGVYVYVEKIRERDSSSFEALRFTVPACSSNDPLYSTPY